MTAATSVDPGSSKSGGLVATGLVAGYHQTPVLRSVDVSVDAGEIVCVLGANGAGKSTLARALAGLLAVREGTIELDGCMLSDLPVSERVMAGVSLVPEGRALFPRLRVKENLMLGAFRRNRGGLSAAMTEVLDLFPVLAPRLNQVAGTLSGGEQQMVAIARALMARPTYLVLDEPSLGLAPIIIERILVKVRELASSGMGIILIEQNASLALAISDRAVVIERGVVVMSGDAATIRDDGDVVRAYFGGLGRVTTTTHSNN